MCWQHSTISYYHRPAQTPAAAPHGELKMYCKEPRQDALQPLPAFLPHDDTAQRDAIEAALFEQDMELLTWRSVPIRPEVLGEIAASSRPEIWHILITADDQEFFDRRLFLARKQFERAARMR